MSDASEKLAGDLEHTLEQIARAVSEVIPGNDVFEPQGLVTRWLAGLELEDRGRLLTLLRSEQWQEQLASIARSVVAGGAAWPAGAAAEASAASPADILAQPS